MAQGRSIGTVFVELDLDPSLYTRKQKQILAGARTTALSVEKNWETIGSQSDRMYDAMRQRVINAYGQIKNSAKTTASEMVRLEQAKNARLKEIDDQQFGRQTSMIEKLKNNWVAAAGAITAAYFAARKAWSLAEQAAEFEQSQQAFRSMAKSMGADAEEIFGRVRRLSGGLIDDASMVKSMNKAISLGIPIEKLGDLMEVARAKSRDMGITASQAFDDIATGIGRASPLILDNLGLSLKLGAANESMAASLGKTVEQLTDKEKKTAILNATLEAGKESLSRYNLEILTTKERMNAFEVQIKNIGTAIGGFVLRFGAGLLGVLNTVAAVASSVAAAILAIPTALAKATDFLGVTEGAADALADTMDALSASSEDLLKKAGDNYRLAIGGFSGASGPAPNRNVGSSDTSAKKDPAAATGNALREINEQIATNAANMATYYESIIEQNYMAAKLLAESTRNRFIAEAELQELHLAQQSEGLDEWRQTEMDAWSAYYDYVSGEAERSAANQAAVVDALGAAFSGLSGTMLKVYQTAGKQHKGFFRMYQATSAAEATVSAYAGAAMALKTYPYPYSAIVAGIVLASGLANVASIMSAKPAAHGGLDYVPAETTYLLDKGERVVSPKQNKDLTEFLSGDKGGGRGGGDIYLDGSKVGKWFENRARQYGGMEIVLT